MRNTSYGKELLRIIGYYSDFYNHYSISIVIWIVTIDDYVRE